MKLNNKYYILRHGEAISNVKDIVSCWPEKFENPLTEAGVTKIKNVVGELKNKNIDLIFASPLLRTEQTAKIVGGALKIKPKIDKRLREIDFGVFNGEPEDEFIEYFRSRKERLNKGAPKGESYANALKRIWIFFQGIDKKYKEKNILIVSHQAPLLLLLGKIKGHSILESMDGIIRVTGERRITKGQLIKVN